MHPHRASQARRSRDQVGASNGRARSAAYYCKQAKAAFCALKERRALDATSVALNGKTVKKIVAEAATRGNLSPAKTRQVRELVQVAREASIS